MVSFSRAIRAVKPIVLSITFGATVFVGSVKGNETNGIFGQECMVKKEKQLPEWCNSPCFASFLLHTKHLPV